jgi:membrane protease YdiL (CAAX protease family)
MKPLRQLVATYPTSTFLVGALVTQVLFVSSQYYEIRNYGLGALRIFAPALWALTVAAVAFGKADAWKLLSSLGVWRIAPKYYAFALLYPSVVAVLALGILRLVGLVDSMQFDFHEAAGFDFFWLTIRISFVEEVAWVGFLLAIFARRWRLFAACIAAGAAWGVWYVPLVLTGIQVAPGLPILPLILNFMTIAAICGWLYVRTRSALVVFVMQVTTNYTSQIIPVLPLRGGLTQYVAFVLMKCVLGLVLYLIWGPKPLFGSVGAGRSSLEPSAPLEPSTAPGAASRR